MCACADRDNQVERDQLTAGGMAMAGGCFNRVGSGGSQGSEKCSDFIKATQPLGCRSGFRAGLPG